MSAPQTTRHAVLYFPSRDTGVLPVSGDGWFLARDIPLGIMPLRHGAGDRSVKVELQPHDDKVAEWLTSFLYIGQFEPRYLERAVEDFVQTAASYIGYYGEIYFDITEDNDGRPARLRPLPHGRILRSPRKYLQIIPKADRQHRDGHRYVAIAKQSLWRLGLPKELGTARSYRRLVRRLSELSPLGNRLALPSPDATSPSGYDFVVHRDACERLQEKALRKWGTVLSKQSPVGPSTEYFYIARRLSFHRSQARLREHVIAELNSLLARLDIAHSIVVSGIPTAEDIGTTLNHLHKGEIGFKDALDRTSI
jgi:hypothetical protein